MKDISRSYQKGVRKNILEIKTILKDLRIEKEIPFSLYKNVLDQSANNIISKWVSGKKYCRTYFTKKAFGRLYPAKYTQISLCIDAMVNILDDLLDESLAKKTKSKYVIEFLRVFSLYNNKYIISKEIQKSLEKYFNKLITLAIAENFYQNKIAQEQNLNEIIKNSADLLMCRGMDIDIFVEIALSGSGFKDKRIIMTIKRISKLFRGINILKKDIKDIQHDRKNNIETIVTLVLSKSKVNFSLYINSLLNLFSNKTNLMMKSVSKKSLRLLPVYNFNQMIQEEKKEILKIIQSL
jgi:hypothetical protein